MNFDLHIPAKPGSTFQICPLMCNRRAFRQVTPYIAMTTECSIFLISEMQYRQCHPTTKSVSNLTLWLSTIFADSDECSGNHGCSHGCDNTEGSYQCLCPRDMVLSSDRRTCRAQEGGAGCGTNKGGCSHTCQDQGGNAQCSCPDYLTLGADGKTCVRTYGRLHLYLKNSSLCAHIYDF